MRVITLDATKKVTGYILTNEYYVLQPNDIISDIGQMGQIQQPDGSFLTPTPPPPSLSDTQVSKIAQITDLYNQKLTAGFTSNSNIYGYAPSDVLKFLQLDTLINKSMATFPVTVHTKGNKDIQLTQTQYTQLIVDMATFAQTQDHVYHDFINRVNACTTVDGVNEVVVTF